MQAGEDLVLPLIFTNMCQFVASKGSRRRSISVEFFCTIKCLNVHTFTICTAIISLARTKSNNKLFSLEDSCKCILRAFENVYVEPVFRKEYSYSALHTGLVEIKSKSSVIKTFQS